MLYALGLIDQYCQDLLILSQIIKVPTLTKSSVLFVLLYKIKQSKLVLSMLIVHNQYLYFLNMDHSCVSRALLC